MKYFVSERERKNSNTTCYLEFQKGKSDDECWKADSVCIRDSLWDEYELSELFESVVPNFDYYGTTEITREQWEEIVKRCQDTQQKRIIEDVCAWVDTCFESFDCFSIVGM